MKPIFFVVIMALIITIFTLFYKFQTPLRLNSSVTTQKIIAQRPFYSQKEETLIFSGKTTYFDIQKVETPSYLFQNTLAFSFTIDAINVSIGSIVKKGDSVATISPSSKKLFQALADKESAKLKTLLMKEKRDYQALLNSQRYYNAYEKLYKNGTISYMELQNRKLTQETLELEHDKLIDTIKQQQSIVSDMTHFTVPKEIVSPSNAIVLDIAKKSTYLKTTKPMPILILGTLPMTAIAQIPPQEVSKIKIGQLAEIQYNSTILSGKIIALISSNSTKSSLDSIGNLDDLLNLENNLKNTITTHFYTLQIQLSDANLQNIEANTPVTIKVYISKNNSAILIPNTAIISENSAHFIYLLKDNRVIKHPVNVIKTYGYQSEVKPLTTSDLIILSLPKRFSPNSIVKPSDIIIRDVQ